MECGRTADELAGASSLSLGHAAAPPVRGMCTGAPKAWEPHGGHARKLAFALEHLCRRGLLWDGLHFLKNVPSNDGCNPDVLKHIHNCRCIYYMVISFRITLFGFKVHIATNAEGMTVVNFCFSNGSAHDVCF
jgi:hypothetical protein